MVEAMRTAATTELLPDRVRSTPPHTQWLINVTYVLLGFLTVARADREAAARFYSSIVPRRG